MISTLEAQEQLNTKRGNATILLGEEYKGDKKRHNFRCSVCGHKWENTPNALKRSSSVGCPNCSKNCKQNVSKTAPKSPLKNNAKLGYKYSEELRNSKVQPMPNLSSVNVLGMRKRISVLKKEVSDALPIVKEFKRIDEQQTEQLHEAMSKTWQFDIMALILLPIWFIVKLIQDSSLEPYRQRKIEALNKLYAVESKYTIMKEELDNLKNNKLWREERAEYIQHNNERLKAMCQKMMLGGQRRLYYFRFRQNNQSFYKVGIMNSHLGHRYGSSYRLIDKIFVDVALTNAEEIERIILHTFKDKLANDSSLLQTAGGWTEVFTTDVLKLDTY